MTQAVAERRAGGKDGRLKRANPVSPARREPTENTYRVRVTQRWTKLRAGRDVSKIVSAIKRNGYERVSKATYYNWESGETDPPISAYPAIARALGVTIDELFPT